jgi:hypothetical protein
VLIPQMLDKGFWADVEVAGGHLRLFSEHNAQGIQFSVYDVNSKNWIVTSEAVNDIEQGKEKATKYVRAYLMYFGRSDHQSELPPVIWKKAPSL